MEWRCCEHSAKDHARFSDNIIVSTLAILGKWACIRGYGLFLRWSVISRVGLVGGGLFRSTDNGATSNWSLTDSPLGNANPLNGYGHRQHRRSSDPSGTSLAAYNRLSIYDETTATRSRLLPNVPGTTFVVQWR